MAWSMGPACGCKAYYLREFVNIIFVHFLHIHPSQGVARREASGLQTNCSTSTTVSSDLLMDVSRMEFCQ
jgi:hypothetical protein